MHESILGHTLLHSPATIYSLVHPQKCTHSRLCRAGGRLHIRHPALRRLPIYWPHALKYWWFASWWWHTSTATFYIISYVIIYMQANSWFQLIWIVVSKTLRCWHFSNNCCDNMQLSGIVLAAVGCTGQRHQHCRLCFFPLCSQTGVLL